MVHCDICAQLFFGFELFMKNTARDRLREKARGITRSAELTSGNDTPQFIKPVRFDLFFFFFSMETNF